MCSFFNGVTISEEQARSGIVVRDSESPQPHKLLFFEQEIDGGYGLALQNILIIEGFKFNFNEDIMAYQALLGSKDQD
uniref:Uncharacterized protein n=1 Tax=Oryza rufipogon TaxID=4529 RepID=A0A0E0RHT0_ORYRU